MVKAGDWVSQGWAMIKPNLGTHILIALVVGLLSSVTLGILSGPLACGWFMILLRQQREPSYQPQFGDLWKGFEVFAQSFVAWLIIAIVVAIASGLTGVISSIVGEIPLIGWIVAPFIGAIVAICAMVVFLYVFPLIADGRADAVEAIKRSAETTTPEFIPFAGFTVILYVLQVIGGALCGIGLLITGPIVMGSVAVAYMDVLGGGAAPEAPATPETPETSAPTVPPAPEPTEETGPPEDVQQ
jgi:hypothetical protein